MKKLSLFQSSALFALLLLLLNGFKPPAAFAACPYQPSTNLHALHDHYTPLINHMVTVEGIINAIFMAPNQLGGFFIQSLDKPESGIFVYSPNVYPQQKQLRVGTHILIRARLREFKGQLELGHIDQMWICGQRALSPATVNFTKLGKAQLQAMEGVLIRIADKLVVVDNHQLAQHGNLALAPLRSIKGITNSATDNNLILDDGSYHANPRPVPYLNHLGTRRTGSSLNDLTGILTFAFDHFRLHPTQQPQFSDENPRPPSLNKPLVGSLRIASFNIENYFLTEGARGAKNLTGMQEQRSKLIPAIVALNADLLTLMEVENEPAALQDLVDRINLSQPVNEQYLTVAGQRHWGADTIRVAILFKPSRLSLLKLLADDRQADFIRPPLIASFTTHQGYPLTIVAAHFKSKAGCPRKGDVDDGQGCWNQKRLLQSRALRTLLRHLRLDNNQLLIMGDLNSYEGEAPLKYLMAHDLRDTIAERVSASERYTYIYHGMAGALDHILAGKAIDALITQAGIWHINADEPAFLAYDRDWTQSRNIYRSSDHDPIWVDLQLH